MEKQYQSQNKTFIIHSQNHYFIMIHFLMVQIEGFLRVVTSTPKLLIPPLFFFFHKTLHYYSFLSPFFPFPVPLQFLHILFPFIFSLCFSLQTIPLSLNIAPSYFLPWHIPLNPVINIITISFKTLFPHLWMLHKRVIVVYHIYQKHVFVMYEN